MEPLASKIRPTALKEFVGQKHLVGHGKPLSIAVRDKHLFSFIFWVVFLMFQLKFYNPMDNGMNF